MLELDAPAKLNLFLKVTGRRADGYHELATAFRFLDAPELCDRIRLIPRDDGRILRRGGAGLPERDLCLQAAEALQRATGSGLGVEIELDKRIPVGAGLGGGSSDAASVLLGLDRLWGTGLGEEALAALGLELGADVPVFVRGRAALAGGVGERLEPLVGLPERWYLVLDPGVVVSTREVFETPELTRDSATPRIRAPQLAEDLADLGNDCLPVVEAHHPEVAAARAWLDQRGAARLTGTGAALYLGTEDREEAEAVRATIPAPWRGWVARGCDRSPAHVALEQQGAAPGCDPTQSTSGA